MKHFSHFTPNFRRYNRGEGLSFESYLCKMVGVASSTTTDVKETSRGSYCLRNKLSEAKKPLETKKVLSLSYREGSPMLWVA